MTGYSIGSVGARTGLRIEYFVSSNAAPVALARVSSCRMYTASFMYDVANATLLNINFAEAGSVAVVAVAVGVGLLFARRWPDFGGYSECCTASDAPL